MRRANIEYRNYRVHTPDGDGVVVSVAQDLKTLKCYALVKLDNDKGVFQFNEKELTAIESTPKTNNLFNGNPEENKEIKEPLIKDADVIKALECCQLSNTHQVEDCDKCPFNEIPQTICQNLLAYHALQIIKRGTR